MASGKSPGLDYGAGINGKDMGDGIQDYGLMLPEYENSRELKRRGGLPNVLHKLTGGQKVTVGYIGGSITYQEGWRPRTTSWLKSRFPHATIGEVNAAISGTGADLGAARIERDLLVHEPDLIFVEFVVNGAGLQDVEGLVRKVWRNNPSTDICFVYTVRSDQADSYKPGSEPSFPSSLTAFETVAEHYGIPGIFFGYVLGELYALGKLVPKGEELIDAEGRVAFTKDGIHPVGTGDQLYAGAVARSVITMQEQGTEPTPHVLRSPLNPYNWEDATMRVAADFTSTLDVVDTTTPDYDTSFPYSGLHATVKKMYPSIVKMTKPGDRITVTFKGTRLGIADVGGPFSGQLSVKIDDREPMTVNRFMVYNSYLRHQYFFLPELEDTEHTVTLTLMSETADKHALVLNKADYEQNPDVYQGNAVYIGYIIAVGRFLT